MDKTAIINLAFFDAEFTALSAHDRGVQEMIQCSLIVHQIEMSAETNRLLKMTDKPAVVYRAFVKPIYNTTLSEYIKDLTKIRQEDVDSGKRFHNVIDDIYNLCNEYKIKKVLTWGPDRALVKTNCSTSGYNTHKSRVLCGKFQDVSKLISSRLGYDLPISQHKACELLNIPEDGNAHDAYYDATNLSKIIKKFCRQ